MMNNNYYQKKRLSLIIVLIFMCCGYLFSQTYPGKVGVGIGHLELVDLAKYLRAFTAPDGTEVQVDANGWPLADAQTVLFDFRPVPEWEAGATLDDPEEYRVDRSGTYKASFQGQADVEHVEGPFTIENKVYDPNTNTTKFDIVIGAPGPHHGLVILNFVNTKRTASSALNSGITNLKVIRPGYAENTTQVFTDDFLNGIANGNFSTLRFMGATHTNNSNPFYPEVTEWSQRAKVENATFNSDNTGREPGIPWELAVDLGNATNTDIWVNVPVAATDNYITQLATLIKNRLNPGLKVYVEYSNEVWNWGFSQSVWNNQKAESEGLNYAKGYAKRTAEIAMIFKNVYGASAMNNDVRVISAWQIGWSPPDAMYEEQMQYMNDFFGPPKDYIYGLGVAPYFNCGDVCETGTVQEILAAMRQSSDESRLDREKIVAVASKWQIPGGMVSYEAGSDTGGGSATNIANKITAERSAEMKEIYLYDARENWFAIGGGLQMYLELVGPYSRYGSWGLTDDMSNVDRNYKFGAVRELAGSDATTAPPTPAGLAATPGNATVSLSWSPASTSDHYNVKRSTTSGGPYTTVGSPSTTSYTDNTVTNETTYYYVVSAVNSVGESSNSSQVSATPTATSTVTVTREYWSGISGTSVADIPLSTSPTGTDQLSSLEGPVDWADNYGTRIRAFVRPSASGSYTFYISSDDNSELWLSTDASPGNTSKIAEVVGWTGSREWSKYASQTSAAVSLSADTDYYIEILHKEGTGGDNVAVGWTGPGISNITVIGSENLVAYSPQPPAAPTLSATAGDASVSLSWNSVSGATSYKVKRHTGGNFNTVASNVTSTSYQDNNLVNGTTYFYAVTAVNENGESTLSNTEEATPSAAPIGDAGLTYEYYEGSWSLLPNFDNLTAIKTGNVANFDLTPRNRDDNFGFRFKGYIDIATAGDYTFYTTSDDGSKLYINGTQVVDNDGLHGSQEMSGIINLTAGKHPITVTFFEATGGEVLEVRYSGPGVTKQLVPNSVLSTSGGVTGDIVREYWTGVSGTSVADIPLTTAPSGTDVLTSLEAPVDWADSYGTRIRGYIIPEESGSYTFYVSSDDNSELWLSTDQDPANKQKIAEVIGWTSSREWGKYASQQSSARSLTAGTKYYVEVLHKEGGGGDNIAVGWTGPGYSTITVLPGSVLSRYDGSSSPDPEPPSGNLLAYDDFNSVTGTLHQVNTGSGWAAAWQVQNNDISVPGYNIANSSMLSYSGLTTSGNYTIGGDSYQSSGRAIDVSASGPFSAYLSGDNIGASGETLWVSLLMRKDGDNNEEVSVKLHSNTTVTWANPELISIGYFGSASNDASNNKYWSLKIGADVIQSDVPLTVGQTALLVLKIEFGSTSTASLFVNPSSLGGSAPSSANASGTTTTDIAFKSFLYYGGSGTSQSAIDEVRFGDSYSVVTPTSASSRTTSYTDAVSEDNYLIYPNPTSDRITVNFDKGKVINASVFNLQGRTINVIPVMSDGEITIDLSNEQAGIYLLRMEFESTRRNFTIIKK